MIPVIIGVADIKNRSTAVEDAKEPATLMLEAIERCIQDSSTSSQFADVVRSSIDSIDVVRTWTWPYSDLPGLLSEKLGVQAKHRSYSEHGGNQPAKLLDEAARRIATGESKVAVLTGAEALASLAACVKEGKIPPPGWTSPAESVKSVFSPTTRELRKDIGGLHSVGAPIHIYPMYENGFRAHRGQSIKDNHDESTALYADFSKVAASNPYSWNHGKETESLQSIGTVSKRNRMICFPYPLLMNAFNTVNLGAACILTSTEFAKELQIPREKWIYPLGGAGFKERELFWERPNFFESSAISKSLDRCLSASGLTGSEIDIYDFYSCFPIVPKLACHHMGLSITEPKKPITVLGGLTSFGGAGNNYSMHALTEMPRKNHNLYPDSGTLHSGPSDEIPPIDSETEGEARVETYTVEFNRDGSPEQAYIVGRLTGSNHRFLANHGNQATLKRLASTSEEPIGIIGTVMPDPTGDKGYRKNFFYLDGSPKL
ncbi:Thiolase [Penicillium atrosanguineum]|nr:Thiolase [Penicillium atrosanguineum]